MAVMQWRSPRFFTCFPPQKLCYSSFSLFPHLTILHTMIFLEVLPRSQYLRLWKKMSRSYLTVECWYLIIVGSNFLERHGMGDWTMPGCHMWACRAALLNHKTKAVTEAEKLRLLLSPITGLPDFCRLVHL